ncbi:MAG: hypothetical protein GX989_07240 [Firmicutes bacterium]|nr:hypothetical protein [Bacillota bacterium]
MDFSRARTVLIGMFLFLNIFLLYQIWQDEGRGDFLLPGRKEEVSRLETALGTAGFTLDTSLPKGDMRLAHLVVEPWPFDAVELITTLQALWEKEEGPVPLVEGSKQGAGVAEGEIKYSCGGCNLLVKKEGLLVFTANSKEVLTPELDNQEDILNIAAAIIQEIPFMQDFVVDYFQKTEKGIVFHYRQGYEGYPLYGGYAELSCGEKGDRVLSLYRLKPCHLATQEREIISPAAALLRFLEAYEPETNEIKQAAGEKKSIIEISLGFYSHGYDAERWEIPPVWRIRIDSGEVYYVNAFTGNLER